MHRLIYGVLPAACLAVKIDAYAADEAGASNEQAECDILDLDWLVVNRFNFYVDLAEELEDVEQVFAQTYCLDALVATDVWDSSDVKKFLEKLEIVKPNKSDFSRFDDQAYWDSLDVYYEARDANVATLESD